MLLLRRNTDGAIIRMTGPHPKTANRLQGGIRDRNSIRAQGERFGEIRGCSEPTRNDERDIFMSIRIKVTTCARKRWNGWN